MLALAYGAMRRARGIAWRLLALAVLVAILVDPSLVEEQRQPQRDVAAVVVDDSPSMRIGNRRQYADAALQALTQKLQQQKNLDVRIVHAGAPDPNAAFADNGTELYTALTRALSDVPAQRVAGAVMITDGEVHDMPVPDRLAFHAPLHVLLTGAPGEADRRLVVKDAPSFGLVGKDVQLTVRVEDLPDGGSGDARLTLRKDGGATTTRMVPVGQDVPLSFTIDHGGPNVIELEAERGPHELTLDNNRAALVVNGVRDRLKVLLVSGEPHQGERTWRNILKSDPSVDLIHFTILRPPEKQDGTPIRELSLIAFPIRELFDVKIDQFDLIIFDRYRRRSVLPEAYLENIARYVRQGGALLEAAGPNFGTPLSLYRTPLGSVLPAEPTGNVYRAGLRAAGERGRPPPSRHRRPPGLAHRPQEGAAVGALVPPGRGGAAPGRSGDDRARQPPAPGARPRRQGPGGAASLRRDVAVDARLRRRRACRRSCCAASSTG